MRRHVLLLFALVLSARTAAAQPGATEPASLDTRDTTEATNYAATTLAVDALSIGMIVAGAISEGPNGRDTDTSQMLFTVGFLGAWFGTPIVHAAHGHWGRAGASFGMRYGLASLGMVAGIAMTSCDESRDAFCKLGGAGIGMLAGFATASLIDAVFQAGEERPARLARTPRLWAPTVAANQQGVHLGVAAQF